MEEVKELNCLIKSSYITITVYKNSVIAALLESPELMKQFAKFYEILRTSAKLRSVGKSYKI